jgi:hypothetical protein
MKLRLSSLLAVLSLGLIFGPWAFDAPPSKLWYLGYLVATILLAWIGYGAQMKQLGLGDPAEEFLQGLLRSAKGALRRKLGG